MYEFARVLFCMCGDKRITVPLADVYVACGYKNLKTAARAVNREMILDHDYFYTQDNVHRLSLDGVKFLAILASDATSDRSRFAFVNRFARAYREYDPPGQPCSSRDACCREDAC